MPTLNSGRIEVFTFREGLLSPIAHDLRLRLERFEITHNGNAVEGRFWPDSLVVEGVIEHGRLSENVLSEAQRAEIVDTVRRQDSANERFIPRPDFAQGGRRRRNQRAERRPWSSLARLGPSALVVHARDGGSTAKWSSARAIGGSSPTAPCSARSAWPIGCAYASTFPTSAARNPLRPGALKPARCRARR